MSDIAVDTSAIVELMIKGPQAHAVREAIVGAGVAFVTPVARLEAVMVMLGRFGWERATFDQRWRGLALQEVPVDSMMAEFAIDAFQLWGKGRARAALNFGDCFSYALAKARNLPLLCIGDDFSQTDLQTL
jgi:ribonuclease VapC